MHLPQAALLPLSVGVPSAALRLQQLNRLEELKQELTRANARADGARQAHEVLSERLAELTREDQ